MTSLSSCFRCFSAFVLLAAAGCGKDNTAQPPAEPTYTVSILAGTNAGPGYVDGTGSSVRFSSPRGMAIDAQGNVYVADYGNNRIRKSSPTGTVTTFAGSSPASQPDGGYLDGSVAQAQFSHPGDVAADTQGNLYIADMGNYRVRKISANGLVSTVAGSGSRGYQDGPAASARFDMISSLVVDAQGNVYVADGTNYCIRKISPAGMVTTLAGTNDGGYADGTGSAARFMYISGLAIDGQGNIYVADLQNHRIRKVTPAGVVTTIAGSGTSDFTDGPGLIAQFSGPADITIDPQGNLFVADGENNCIRKISPAGAVSTIAGTRQNGFTNGPGSSAQFILPANIDSDAQGSLYVTQQVGYYIRKITRD